jgi:hypothetical protein
MNPRFIFVLALLSCGDDSVKGVCNQALEQSVTMTNSLSRLDSKLSRFTIQPECSVCPPSRVCPDDSVALAKGDEALRQMDELRDIVKRFRNDPGFRYDGMVESLNNLAGE